MSTTLLYLDHSAPIDDRVRDLVSRLTLKEKLDQVTVRCKAIPRLGIPAYLAFGEGLHGVAHYGIATVFPQAIGLSAMFDTRLMNEVASAVSDEARAKFNVLSKVFGHGSIGLSLWAPNINIVRDPRWGRGQETYGEDPVLTSKNAVAYVKGLQGSHPRYLKTAAGAKHYAVHSGPEALRHRFNAIVSAKDLHETYLPAFKACVDTGVEVIMAAYNRTNNEVCAASPTLLKNILRDEWQFDGHVTSDGGAIVDIHRYHKATNNAFESTAFAIRNGCNIEAGGTVFENMGEAIRRGLLSETDVDEAIFYTLRTRFRLGLFDPARAVPFTSISPSVINSPLHRKLSYRSAVKSMVLLKNTGGILPLTKDMRRILVAGPTAADHDAMLGNYYGVNNRIPTILEAIVDRAGIERIVTYRKGVVAHSGNNTKMEFVTRMAGTHDVTIAVMGFTPLIEGEEYDPLLSKTYGDRLDLGFPAHQIDFIKKLSSYKKPVVLVVTSGSAVIAPEIYKMVDAVVYAWYPGQEGGNALADLLFGNAVPSGRLPVSIPQSIDDLPPFEDYAMKNRTYRYMSKEPQFPFGFGLSYTTFAYSRLSLSATAIKAGENITAQVTIKNSGKVAAEEVVQLYITDLKASVDVPQYALKDFGRVKLKAGQSSVVSFVITPGMLELVDNEGMRRLEPGDFKITISAASPSPRSTALGAPKPVSAIVKVRA